MAIPGAMHAHTAAVAVIKSIHTAVFLTVLAAIAWLVASGALGRRDRSVGLAATAVALETAVFVGNGMVCPLTPLAERLGATRGAVTDIFLPMRVAQTIPIWSGALVALAGLLHVHAFARERRSG
jgi:hypothetical protein